jgi:hypothetical protein
MDVTMDCGDVTRMMVMAETMVTMTSAYWVWVLKAGAVIMTMTHPVSTIGRDGHQMVIGQWWWDEVGVVLSVSAEVGAVSVNDPLVHPASTVGCGMWPMLGYRAVVAMHTSIRGGSAGHDMLRWKVLAIRTQHVERRAPWLAMVMILSTVLNKEEEEWLESGCWFDNWWLIGRFICVGDDTSFSSSHWADSCWWIGVGCYVCYLVDFCLFLQYNNLLLSFWFTWMNGPWFK